MSECTHPFIPKLGTEVELGALLKCSRTNNWRKGFLCNKWLSTKEYVACKRALE